ncbi:MAG: ribonuclease HII [Holosporales bacterium]|jgi:ribonuclease HII|nr:ribonuclease HII [Holosporales bacterium]
MPDFKIENLYKGERIYGIDEAGLGPLAGPIVFASCIIKDQNLSDELLENINDSKKLTKKKREWLFEVITNTLHIEYGISVIDNEVIDKLGLSAAWKHGVIESLKLQNPTLCLIDGIKNVIIPKCQSVPVVKGDQKSFSIATASIIAKVTRDRIMKKVHDEFPQYGFDKHVGYGTKLHIDKLMELGPCRYHRKSYSPVKLAIVKNNGN